MKLLIATACIICVAEVDAQSYGDAIPAAPGQYFSNSITASRTAQAALTNGVNNSIAYTAGVSNTTLSLTSGQVAMTQTVASVSANLSTVSNQVQAIPATVFVLTNYPLNTIFTNGSRPIIYMANVSLKAVTVSGKADLQLVTDWVGSGVYSNRYSTMISTTNSGTVNGTNSFMMNCYIPAAARFYTTNASVGTGNSASVLFGVRQQL